MWFWTGFQPYSQFIASSSKDQRPAGDPNISKWCRGLALWEQRQKALPALNLTDPRLERCRGSNGHLFSKKPLTAHHFGSFEQSPFSSSSIYIYYIICIYIYICNYGKFGAATVLSFVAYLSAPHRSGASASQPFLCSMLSVFKVQHDHSQTYLKPTLFKLRDLVAWSLWKKDKEGKPCITLEGTQTLTQAHLNSETFSLPARISWKVADLKVFRGANWNWITTQTIALVALSDLKCKKTISWYVRCQNYKHIANQRLHCDNGRIFVSSVSTILILHHPHTIKDLHVIGNILSTGTSNCLFILLSDSSFNPSETNSLLSSGHLHRTTGSTMWQLVGPTQIVILDHFGYFNTNISSLEEKSFGVIPQHAQLSTQPRATSTESIINPQTPLAVFLVWPAWLPGCVW